MPSDGRNFELVVRQQPKQARMCGVGGKADRRPIDPPPIVQLRVTNANTGSTIPAHSSDKETSAFLQNPYYFMFASLAAPDSDEELHLLKDGKTRYTTGSVVSSLYHLKDHENGGKDAGFFVFPDLSVRTEGSYRLKLSLFEVVGAQVHHCKSIFSKPFYVYTAKKFPGMEESTQLSCSLADQGIKIRIRKDIRVRKRPVQVQEIIPILEEDQSTPAPPSHPSEPEAPPPSLPNHHRSESGNAKRGREPSVGGSSVSHHATSEAPRKGREAKRARVESAPPPPPPAAPAPVPTPTPSGGSQGHASPSLQYAAYHSDHHQSQSPAPAPAPGPPPAQPTYGQGQGGYYANAPPPQPQPAGYQSQSQAPPPPPPSSSQYPDYRNGAPPGAPSQAGYYPPPHGGYSAPQPQQSMGPPGGYTSSWQAYPPGGYQAPPPPPQRAYEAQYAAGEGYPQGQQGYYPPGSTSSPTNERARGERGYVADRAPYAAPAQERPPYAAPQQERPYPPPSQPTPERAPYAAPAPAPERAPYAAGRGERAYGGPPTQGWGQQSAPPPPPPQVPAATPPARAGFGNAQPPYGYAPTSQSQAYSSTGQGYPYQQNGYQGGGGQYAPAAPQYQAQPQRWAGSGEFDDRRAGEGRDKITLPPLRADSQPALPPTTNAPPPPPPAGQYANGRGYPAPPAGGQQQFYQGQQPQQYYGRQPPPQHGGKRNPLSIGSIISDEA